MSDSLNPTPQTITSGSTVAPGPGRPPVCAHSFDAQNSIYCKKCGASYYDLHPEARQSPVPSPGPSREWMVSRIKELEEHAGQLEREQDQMQRTITSLDRELRAKEIQLTDALHKIEIAASHASVTCQILGGQFTAVAERKEKP